MSRKDVFPDFFILGAAKCGTTSVHAWLRQHPGICLSEPKEPVFFSTDFELGLDHYWETYFRHWKDEPLVGDASHRNLYHSGVAERIHEVNPDARFLLFMRNPVERALSHWWHHYTRCKEPLHLEEALLVDYQRVRYGIEQAPRPGMTDPCRSNRGLLQQMGVYRTYIDTGHYAEQLERYFPSFPRDRFKIFLFEELKEKPREVLHEICTFLGVDPSPMERIDLKPKLQGNRLKLRLRHLKLIAGNVRHKRQGAGLVTRLCMWHRRPAMPEETRAWLTRHYRPHIERLEEILGRSLDPWK